MAKFKTIINLKGCDREKVREMCRKIREKDDTFQFFFNGKYLVLISENKDKAYKRGIIFVKKYLKGYDLGFEVAKQ